ncbi:MAG: hypothetical protein M3467_00175 [Actinomycetota bacterium]|nr:hypothetical protein [Actinomycetota bacterium]
MFGDGPAVTPARHSRGAFGGEAEAALFGFGGEAVDPGYDLGGRRSAADRDQDGEVSGDVGAQPGRG